MANTGVLDNGIKAVGEVFLPGTSLLLDGEIKSGAGHALVGLLTGALFGPFRLLVSANSFSKSVSDKHLHNHVMDLFGGDEESDEEGAPAQATATAQA